MHASKTKTRTQKKKLALILSGGGMSTSYSVGVLEALKKIHKIQPDIIIAASGSAGSASYFLTSKFEAGIKKVWLQGIVSKKFIHSDGFKRRVDIDYLIDTILKEKFPLDTQAVFESKTQLLIPVINSKTGSLKYFDNHSTKTDWFEVLRAAKAIPIFYDKSVKIGSSMYHDSHLSSVPEIHIQKAKNLGATHIITVHNTSEVVRFESSILERIWWLKTKTRQFRKKYYQLLRLYDTHHRLQINIHPSRKPFANLLDTKKEDIKDTIRLGYTDTKNNTVLKDFINLFKK